MIKRRKFLHSKYNSHKSGSHVHVLHVLEVCEVYGEGDYYQYEKDEYDTKVIDNCYYNDGGDYDDSL